MSGFAISMIVELLVAGLLVATIMFCWRLNQRLTRLKSDEHSLKATIGELVTVTEIAERAIQGLKVTVRECDATLGDRLRTAERFIADIEREVAAGEEVLAKVSQITKAARTPAPGPAPVSAPPRVAEPIEVEADPIVPPSTSASAMLAAASAFAARRQARAA